MWATIEKLRMRLRTIGSVYSRALGNGRAGGEHDAGAHARAVADPHVGAEHAIPEYGARAHLDPLPEDRALDARVRADARPVADHDAGPDATPRAEHDARADDGRSHDARGGVDGGAAVEPDPVPALAGRRQGHRRAPLEQVELGGAVRRRIADVAPVRGRTPAKARDPVGDQRGEELPLDRAGALARDPAQELGVDQVDAGADRVGRDLLVGGRLLANRPHAPAGPRLD